MRKVLCLGLLGLALLLGGCRSAKVGWWSKQHTNRLVPVYTFGTRGQSEGVDLENYIGSQSAYRREDSLALLYGQVPPETVSPEADYMDITDLYRLQEAAVKAGKRHIFVVIFDGLDWTATRALMEHRLGKAPYTEGRGSGALFQDYQAGGTTQFGYMVTAPYGSRVPLDVNSQKLGSKEKSRVGGYSPARGGLHPWSPPSEPEYLVFHRKPGLHAVTDSASSMTAITTGRKTYNWLINRGPDGLPLTTLPQRLQAQGWKVGAVTSTPISHATPAATYAVGVSRFDYQDLSRDLLGLPSVSRAQPLPGLDLLLGCTQAPSEGKDLLQGKNYVPGNRYLTAEDLKSARQRYVVVEKTAGKSGAELIQQGAERAIAESRPLLGLFGVPAERGPRLPYPGLDSAQALKENPTLAQLTAASLKVLEASEAPFWLLVEPGDVDWACHANNFEELVLAFDEGEKAVKVVVDWVEEHSNWEESLLIVTSDHGHSLSF